jgi:GT2 family glycosyltransferase
VAEIELSSPATVRHISVADTDGEAVRQAVVLVREAGRPLATIVTEAPAGHVDAESCAAEARAAIAAAAAASGAAASGTGAVPEAAPRISVVIATRERTQSLARCLDSMARLDYPAYEVIVVDNAPISDGTAQLVQQRAEPNVRYVREDRRGLAAAHNCGLAEAEGSIVAFTDDDVIVDERWLMEIASGFQAADDVACVTGLIMPAELQTPAQVMLETHGNFGKGFSQRVMDLGANRPADPLFPFTAGKLGSGANMSFDRDKLRAVGGFDPAIGTGTVARGGDDLAAFFTVITSGFQLVYQPSALVWHHHRRDNDSLSGQAYGYGVGLGAYLTSSLCRHPASIGRALLRTPGGLVYAFSSGSPRNAAAAHGDWPPELTRLERKGLLLGPIAYGRSRWQTRRHRRSSKNGAR